MQHQHSTDDHTNQPARNEDKSKYDKGSKSDPQKTELEGLKEGGREPKVHQDDKARDDEGNPD